MLAKIPACYVLFSESTTSVWMCGMDVMLRDGRKRRSVVLRAFCGNKNSSPPSFQLLMMLYSCGNVIVLVLVHFIDNWFTMILVPVYVCLKINAIKSPRRTASSLIHEGQKFHF